MPKVRVDGVVFEPSFGENSIAIAAPLLKSANSCKIFKSSQLDRKFAFISINVTLFFREEHKTFFNKVKVKEMRNKTCLKSP